MALWFFIPSFFKWSLVKIDSLEFVSFSLKRNLHPKASFNLIDSISQRVRLIKEHSDQGGNHKHQGNDDGHEVFGKHGADDGTGCFVGSNEVSCWDLGDKGHNDEESKEQLGHAYQ